MITEKDFGKWLEDLLDLYGYRWVHFRPARVMRKGKDTYETAYTGYKGFPDYVVCHPELKRLIFIELKSDKGKVSDEQYDWLESLGKSGGEVYIWRPSDRDNIEGILQRKE